jgi:hypothetical protein
VGGEDGGRRGKKRIVGGGRQLVDWGCLGDKFGSFQLGNEQNTIDRVDLEHKLTKLTFNSTTRIINSSSTSTNLA